MRQASAPITAAGDIVVNIESFTRHLRAENLSPRTQQTYIESCRQLARFLADQGMPQHVANKIGFVLRAFSQFSDRGLGCVEYLHKFERKLGLVERFVD